MKPNRDGYWRRTDGTVVRFKRQGNLLLCRMPGDDDRDFVCLDCDEKWEFLCPDDGVQGLLSAITFESVERWCRARLSRNIPVVGVQAFADHIYGIIADGPRPIGNVGGTESLAILSELVGVVQNCQNKLSGILRRMQEQERRNA